MKQVARQGVSILVLMTLSGCVSHINTKGKPLRESEMQQFTMTQPIAIRNVAPNSGEIFIGKDLGWRYYGDYHEYTESCIDSLKIEFKKRNIQISENAIKSLELSVFHASNLGATALLKVKTGSGIEKQYEGRQYYYPRWAVSGGVENALAHCVEQMLNDPDVIGYLQN